MPTSTRRASAGSVIAIAALCSAAAVFGTWGMTASAQSSPRAVTPHALTFKSLKLINGWHVYGGQRTPSAAIDSNGIVHLKGAIHTGGTNHSAFFLPAGMSPSNLIYITVDICDGYTGRLDITTDGKAYVETPTGFLFGKAQCFTSLEGVSFVR
jgi:hypothetical protein